MARSRVLIVEDDPDLRGLLAQGLGEAGYEVVVARSGGEALRAAARHPDVVVLDIGLPDADGRDVLQAMRARGVAAPVIFLTARDASADRRAGLAVGADDYLTKPFVFAELLARLHALLRHERTGPGQSVGN